MGRPGRLLRHLVETRWATRRRFSRPVLDRIEAAVSAAEGTHGGELRVIVETDLDAWSILSGKTSRQRAVEVFAAAHVWDTARNNGVLLYVLFADRAVEIVADRGFNGLVVEAEWAGVCRAMETEFRHSRWETGVVGGVQTVMAFLARHFPSEAGLGNELPDRPVLL